MTTFVPPRPAAVRPPRQRRGLALLSVLAKGLCGAVLALLLVVAWHQLEEGRAREARAARWADATTYAVFYPQQVGLDEQEVSGGGHATKIAEARDLYPVLDEAGALFVDAQNHEPGIPDDPPVPVWPMRVNDNYLERYPILDVAGQPVRVGDDEADWVVLVPETHRGDEASITEFFTRSRVGGPDFQGAVQGQEMMLREPVPDGLRAQSVRIVWTRAGQDVFTFNSQVNADGGNTVRDPIIEVLTPANSLTIDRMNAIRGHLNSPLKVRVDGDPAGTLARLQPLLRQLHLDDNLQNLVTGNEAMLMELDELRRMTTTTLLAAAAALGVMLAFSAALVLVLGDALRQRITVRRLHGFSFVRTYRELLAAMAATWLGQLALAGLLMGAALALPRATFAPPPPPLLEELGRLVAIMGIVAAVEVAFVAAVVILNERRNTATRLKELQA